MEPSAKEFQDSDRGEPPNGVRMFVPGNEFLCFFEFGFRRGDRPGVRAVTARLVLVRENHLFQNIFHGGSRDALVHLFPMDPFVKAFQDSDRGEPPSGVRMVVPGNEFC